MCHVTKYNISLQPVYIDIQIHSNLSHLEKRAKIFSLISYFMQYVALRDRKYILKIYE